MACYDLESVVADLCAAEAAKTRESTRAAGTPGSTLAAGTPGSTMLPGRPGPVQVARNQGSTQAGIQEAQDARVAGRWTRSDHKAAEKDLMPGGGVLSFVETDSSDQEQARLEPCERRACRDRQGTAAKRKLALQGHDTLKPGRIAISASWDGSRRSTRVKASPVIPPALL